MGQAATGMAMRVVLLGLLSLGFLYTQCTVLTNYNLVSVEDSSWITDYTRTQAERGPM